MKRLLFTALLTLMAICFAACSSNNQESHKNNDQNVAEDEVNKKDDIIKTIEITTENFWDYFTYEYKVYSTTNAFEEKEYDEFTVIDFMPKDDYKDKFVYFEGLSEESLLESLEKIPQVAIEYNITTEYESAIIDLEN